MSSSQRIILPVLASLAIIFILIDPSIADNKNKKLEKACSKTKNQDQCMYLMKASSSSIEGADYKAITKLGIKLAYDSAKDTYKNIKSLIDYGGYGNPESVYDKCHKGYAYAAEDLEEMKKYLKEDNYKEIEEHIKVAVKQIDNCKNELTNTEWYVTELAQRTDEFEILCDVVKYAAKHSKGDN